MDATNEIRVPVDFDRSQQCRVIHVDGALGGSTPQGLIHMALYSETAALPSSATMVLGEDGLSRTEIVEQPPVLHREIEVDAIMSVTTARRLAEWLLDRAKLTESLQRPDQDQSND